jgi:hypothetical protein
MLCHTFSAVAYHEANERTTSHASTALAYQILPDPSCMVCRAPDNASFIIILFIKKGKSNFYIVVESSKTKDSTVLAVQ